MLVPKGDHFRVTSTSTCPLQVGSIRGGKVDYTSCRLHSRLTVYRGLNGLSKPIRVSGLQLSQSLTEIFARIARGTESLEPAEDLLLLLDEEPESLFKCDRLQPAVSNAVETSSAARNLKSHFIFIVSSWSFCSLICLDPSWIKDSLRQ
jgi:hypothetical protein